MLTEMRAALDARLRAKDPRPLTDWQSSWLDEARRLHASPEAATDTPFGFDTNPATGERAPLTTRDLAHDEIHEAAETLAETAGKDIANRSYVQSRDVVVRLAWSCGRLSRCRQSEGLTLDRRVNASASWIRSAGLLIPLICLAYYVTSELLLILGAARDVLAHGGARRETLLLSSALLGDVGNLGAVLSAVMVGLVGWFFVALIRARFGPETRPAMLAGVVLVFGFAWASWVVPGRYVALQLAGMGYERCAARDVIQGASEGMVAVSRSGSRVRRYDAWTRPGSCRAG